MSDTKVIDGKQIAADLRLETKDRVSDFKSKYNKVPTLAVVLVGEDPASQVYVNTKTKMAKDQPPPNKKQLQKEKGDYTLLDE